MWNDLPDSYQLTGAVVEIAPFTTQKVFLNFDAEKLPWWVKAYKVDPPFRDPIYIIGDPEGVGTRETIHDVSGLPEFRADVEETVRNIFLNSGIPNVEFVDDPAGATTVWFVKMPGLGDTTAGQALPGNLEWWHFWDGIDRFNTNEDDSVVVFVDPFIVEQGNSEGAAETIAHELVLQRYKRFQ